MVGNLAEQEISELLGFVAELENSSVFADDGQGLLPHMDDELGPQDGVVPSSYDADFHRGAGRGGEGAPMTCYQGILKMIKTNLSNLNAHSGIALSQSQ